MSSRDQKFKALDIVTTQGPAGTLRRESQFVFRYEGEAIERPDHAISLTMPVTKSTYATNRIPPVLSMQMPEGYLLNFLFERLGKTVNTKDEMNLLGLVSTPTSGRVYAKSNENAPTDMSPVSLEDLLAAPGTEELFLDLLQRYVLGTSISGVQPKVVVPAIEPLANEQSPGILTPSTGSIGITGHAPRVRITTPGAAIIEKSVLRVPNLIVKADPVEWPGLSENEFHCMSIVKRSPGLEVPAFWLSNDRKIFTVARFDLDHENHYLGFEDMGVLTGRHADKKYEGSYAQVALALERNCASAERRPSLERFFRQLVLCCLLRNGDAHLKNWGVLYGDPVSADRDARLSPAYDMVCTTAFIAKDVLALSLEGSKAWPDRERLEKFGSSRCGLSNASEVIDELREAAASYRPAEDTPVWLAMKEHIDAAIAHLAPERIVARRNR